MYKGIVMSSGANNTRDTSIADCQASRSLPGCHSERSEESLVGHAQILRCAQNDRWNGFLKVDRLAAYRRYSNAVVEVVVLAGIFGTRTLIVPSGSICTSRRGRGLR